MKFFDIKKNISILIFLLLVGISIFHIVRADDDEEEKDDSEVVIDTANSASSGEVKRIIRLPDKIITKTILEDVLEKDSDRDGIADINDPFPNIATILMVQDVNRNGIDDQYDLSLK